MSRNDVYRRCLKCYKTKSECKCEGGFKIIYHRGNLKSKKEMEAILKTEDVFNAAKDSQELLRKINEQ